MDDGEIERLLGRCALGDREAFRRLYDVAAPKLFGVSLRILAHRGDAEEATQEAFVRIGRRPAAFVPTAAADRAGSWRSRATPRSTGCGCDGRRTRDIADMVDLADPGPRPEASAAAADDRRRIEGCLGALPEDRAGAVRAPISKGTATRSWRGPSTVPLNTMRTWLRRALIALRKCLEA